MSVAKTAEFAAAAKKAYDAGVAVEEGVKKYTGIDVPAGGPLEAVVNPKKFFTKDDQYWYDLGKSKGLTDQQIANHPDAPESLKESLRAKSSAAAKAKQTSMPKPKVEKKKAAQGADRVRVAPVATGLNRTVHKPSITVKDGKTRVRHREYVTDVQLGGAGTSADPGSELPFEVDGEFHLNPGNTTLFPWLSSIAHQFQLYDFKKLAVELATTAATSAAGMMMAAIDVDASDQAPVSKRDMLNYEGAERAPLWQTAMVQHCPQRQLNGFAQKRFVRGDFVPTDADIKTYDAGTLYVAAADMPVGETTNAELWVDYDVEFDATTLDPSLQGVVTATGAYPLNAGPTTDYQVFGSAPPQAIWALDTDVVFKSTTNAFTLSPPNQGVIGGASAGLMCRQPGWYMVSVGCFRSSDDDSQGTSGLDISTDSPANVDIGAMTALPFDVSEHVPNSVKSNYSCLVHVKSVVPQGGFNYPLLYFGATDGPVSHGHCTGFSARFFLTTWNPLNHPNGWLGDDPTKYRMICDNYARPQRPCRVKAVREPETPGFYIIPASSASDTASAAVARPPAAVNGLRRLGGG